MGSNIVGPLRGVTSRVFTPVDPLEESHSAGP